MKTDSPKNSNGLELLFFDLIQVALRKKTQLSKIPSEEEWSRLYLLSQEQTIAGVVFDALDVLSRVGQKPPMEVLFKWIGLSEQIKQQNRLLNERCIELQNAFTTAGFRTCILKGQGNALLYPSPMLRQCGDIDIWVEGKIKNIVAYLSSKCDEKKLTNSYHHTNFPLWNDVQVEVHWRPSWHLSPVYNYRLQKWFKEQAISQFANTDEKSGMHVPTWEFNVVYLLQHMFLHVLQEGLGLRQVMDYYYLLISDGRGEKEDVYGTLNYLGLWKFAGKMMYVLQKVFQLDDEYMIAPVDEVGGRLLLRELLLSGNFGHYDIRNKKLHQKKGLSRSFAVMGRQFRYLKEYPLEVLSVPFLVYHVMWRKLKLWKF